MDLEPKCYHEGGKSTLSNSLRAQNRRKKRSKLSKGQRARLAGQYLSREELLARGRLLADAPHLKGLKVDLEG